MSKKVRLTKSADEGERVILYARISKKSKSALESLSRELGVGLSEAVRLVLGIGLDNVVVQ